MPTPRRAAILSGRQQPSINPATLPPTFWYDPSDITTLFQDTAGTVPVTAPGDPVGRVNDKSGNGYTLTQGTATARPIYQVDSSGKPYLLYDAIDDFLASVSMTLSSFDNMTIWAGARKLSDAAQGFICILSNSVNTVGSFYLSYPQSAAGTTGVNLRGTTTNVQGTIAGGSPPVSAALVGTYNFSANNRDDAVGLYVNGSKVIFTGGITGDPGATNLNNNILYVGARSTVSARFNGRLYQLVGKATTDPLSVATIKGVSRYVQLKTGYT